MKPTLSLPVLIALLFAAWSCAERKKSIVSPSDYETYLSVKQASNYSIKEDLEFWSDRLSRMPDDEGSKIKIAGLHAANFRKTGELKELHRSDSMYRHLLETTTSAKAGLYLSLAQNAITQHAFRQAGAYADSALREGGREAASYLVATDVALELGDIQSATWALQKFTNKNSFAHLIRQAKVKDHEGQLDSAIIIMEQAFSRIKGNKDLYCWTLSNLGDMYGHASRVTDAYQAYLSVLQKDPGYDYALKGIAWIALSHDHNYTEAKRIITTLASRSRMPEAHLMLKEIAEMENDNREKLKQLELFLAMTGHDAYQAMYAKYLAIVYIDDLQNPEKGLAIAENEIASRPTAQSFALKAWALLNLGRKKEALQIAQQYVEGRTFEPEVIYYLALIYKANGLEDEAEEYLEKAFESTFELGPSAAATIKRQLDK